MADDDGHVTLPQTVVAGWTCMWLLYAIRLSRYRSAPITAPLPPGRRGRGRFDAQHATPPLYLRCLLPCRRTTPSAPATARMPGAAGAARRGGIFNALLFLPGARGWTERRVVLVLYRQLLRARLLAACLPAGVPARLPAPRYMRFDAVTCLPS